MEKNTNNLLASWLSLLGASSLLMIIQTSFWPHVLTKHNLVPQLSLPIVIYFFIEKTWFSSLLFIFFISIISSSFSVMTFPYLVISYFILFLITKCVQSIYRGDRDGLFFILIFSLDLLLSYSLNGIFIYHGFYFSTHLISQIFSAFITLGIGLLLYPLLNKFLKEPVGF